MPSDGSPLRENAEGMAEALAKWDLGTVEWTEPLAGGSRSSPKLVVHAQRGRYVLKRRARGRDESERVAFSHAFIEAAAKAGAAVAVPVPARDGTTWQEWGGGTYELFPLIAGARWLRAPAQARAAGDALGRLHAAGLRLQWHGHVRAASFHGSLNVFEALRRVPKAVRAVDPTVDAEAMLAACETLSSAYREAADQVEGLGYGALDSQVVHGDFHPGNVLFEGERVSGVIDFDAARVEPAIVDFANALLQFSSRAGGAASVATWPADLSEDRMAAFAEGFRAHGDPSIAMMVEMVAPLMMEACITECALPIARHGTFGSVRASDMLALVVRKVHWMRDRAGTLQRRLRSVLA